MLTTISSRLEGLSRAECVLVTVHIFQGDDLSTMAMVDR